uniref:Alpha-soluble NSF attachment protein n=1 Tax=Spongospora subterranea TaxID=70186 RepID=A0A0H5R5C5_9EUKA|eukprot:CRZ08992.1 hypothetical protein [Spongospora subterranea]
MSENDDLCPEGSKLRAEADKKLKSFNLFGSASKRQGEAADLYARAAAKFRVARLWEEAAEAYLLAAKNLEKSSPDDWVDARKNYEECAKCFAKCKPEDAIEPYRAAAALSLKENSFSMAAHLYKSLGEMCEQEELEMDTILEAYTKAATYFEAADAVKNQLDMLMKVAFMNARLENYNAAIEAYDQIIRASTKGASKSTGEIAVFNCVLCSLASKEYTTEKAESGFESYKDMFDGFARSTNGKLLEGIFDAIRQSDVDKWEGAIKEADRRSTISSFHRSLLSQAQQLKLEGGTDEVDLM